MNNLNKLTKCEIEILQLSCKYDTSKEVAEARISSKRTVDFHLANAYKKLKVNSIQRAIVEALRLGYITINEG